MEPLKLQVCKKCGVETDKAEAHVDADRDCVCDDCGEPLHSFKSAYFAPAPTVTLISSSGSAVARGFNTGSYGEYFFTLTGRGEGSAAYKVDVEKDGYYVFENIAAISGGISTNGVGSGDSYGKYTSSMTWDGEETLPSGTKTIYLTKGTHTLILSCSHPSTSNADIHTNFSHRIRPAVIDKCYK